MSTTAQTFEPDGPAMESGVPAGWARRTPWAFWALGTLLILYVALCTGFRENLWGTDAWEHHRAIQALAQDLHHPTNPTFVSDQPSVRFSPYSVGWAMVVRATGINAFDALSIAAVVNTALLVLALWLLLAAFGQRQIAAAALLAIISLYGADPQWANSLALADLPWVQTNPSAWALPIALLAAAGLKWMTDRPGRFRGWWLWPVLGLLMSDVMLDHGMTGIFGFILLLAIAATRPPSARLRAVVGVLVMALAVIGVCALWPWYDFLRVVRSHPNNEVWYRADIVRESLLTWSPPAAALAFCAWPWRRVDLVRVMLLATLACWVATLVGLAARSAALGRLPLPALVPLDLAAAVFLCQTGLLRPATWAGRLRRLGGPAPTSAILQVLAAALLLFCLVPQVWAVCNKSELARRYVMQALGRPGLQQHVRQRFTHLLADIGPRDVVLSDPLTSWVVPSFRGRIVGAIHPEFFVPDQTRRVEDLKSFFSLTSDEARLALLDRYQVRWIILNRAQIDPWAFRDLLEETAVVKRDEDMVLMDADLWRQARSRHQSLR